jgi:hypothetical protein
MTQAEIYRTPTRCTCRAPISVEKHKLQAAGISVRLTLQVHTGDCPCNDYPLFVELVR